MLVIRVMDEATIKSMTPAAKVASLIPNGTVFRVPCRSEFLRDDV